MNFSIIIIIIIIIIFDWCKIVDEFLGRPSDTPILNGGNVAYRRG